MSTLRTISFFERERYTKLLCNLAEAQLIISKVVSENKVNTDDVIYAIAQLEISIGVMCMKEDIDFLHLETCLKDSSELALLFNIDSSDKVKFFPRLQSVNLNKE